MLPPSESQYAYGTDKQTDARPLHYAFRYGRGKQMTSDLSTGVKELA